MLAATSTTGVQVDSHSMIGHQHGINQDYVFSASDPVPHIIVGDGCSSSQHTDVGVRLLVLGVRQTLLNHLAAQLIPSVDTLAQEAVYHAQAALRLTGLPMSALDATLGIAFVYEDYVYVYLYGDGTLIYVDIAGRATVTDIHYSHNAPYYLSYRVDKRRDVDYRAKSVGQVKTVSINGKAMHVSVLSPSFYRIPVATTAALVITSDGIGSVIDTRRPRNLSQAEVADSLRQFSNTNGAFVQRRLKRLLKQWAKHGIVNGDDLSVGAIVFAYPGVSDAGLQHPR